jgi:hypothetical protein
LRPLTSGYADASAHDIDSISEPILNKPYRKQQLAEAMRTALRRAA